ncbi:unnamed protein product [Malassezia sympodialis ATCC 42132]|uniref:Small ribosomal subunit protein uS10m n=1 Tax=Malassezia sympodialis (strain ATCC 42132) TaxID=1230383 RepID=M5EAQ3_MALS4|nr:uncharacterized protein MSY001_2425 [Malassezia sympodialis ATCC 42132]CCU99719.1 unnamed protein product [Malassezia sympodialis ATCC 42132]SHO76797.1 Similar to S.cerevisiae protein RSM10 (Mitochondrial ribosomal protein of the small subunit) [Malassezia sympodialis ATCC 42132]|eukprot:XP_018740952.1 uncharacterized protein MSY001_2425 [Malassezia sympodialis ATCC 42132]
MTTRTLLGRALRAYSSTARAAQHESERAVAAAPAAERLLPDVQSPPPTHGVHVATLQLTSYNKKTFELDFFADFALRVAHAMQIPTGGIATLPIRTSLWTVPRGPFVHKKSQENFWRRVHRRSIKIYDASDVTIDRWLQFLRHHEMAGVASKVQLFRRYPLGVGQHMQEAASDVTTSEQAVRAMADEILRSHQGPSKS